MGILGIWMSCLGGIVLKEISYTKQVSEITEEMIADGFFNGWGNPPSKAKHVEILQKSFVSYVAIDTETNQIVGFINAVSDGVLSAYIPLLEVVKPYQNIGIARELVRHMVEELKDVYMVDLLCDGEFQAFYEKMGFFRGRGMMIRNYARQNGNDVN